MVSSTEQSNLESQPEQPEQPEQLELLQSEQPEQSLLEPEQPELEQSQPEPEQPQPQSSDSETETEEGTELEPILEESSKEFYFDNLEEIDLDSIPSEARVYVEPILSHVDALKDTLEAERASYEEVRNQFQVLMDTIDEATKGNIEPIVQEYENIHSAYTQMSTDNVDLAYKLFNMEYPDYDDQPAEVQNDFAQALVHPQFNERFDGTNLYEKMVDAYKLTLYRKGLSVKPVTKNVEKTEAPPVAKQPPSKNVVKQTLVSGGSMAPNMPSINLEEMSYDDILSRGEHLLDL